MGVKLTKVPVVAFACKLRSCYLIFRQSDDGEEMTIHEGC
jgi:hypothetical protein